MPYMKVRGANLSCQAYGEQRPNRAPVVLTHGSTIESHTDWDSIAPELACRYRVFAPDCRGHGRSNNPNLTCSFKELVVADHERNHFGTELFAR
jgi:pimeloyl-ACP methyl ester carboxylesterase